MDPWRRYPFLTSGQSYRMDRFFLKHPRAKPAIAAVFAIALILGAYAIGGGFSRPSLEPFSMEKAAQAPPEPKTIVKTVEVRVPTPVLSTGGILSFSGTEGVLVGGWGDNLQWDGADLKPADSLITIKVDPVNNIGSVIADLKKVSINSEDRTFLRGDVRIEFASFRGAEAYMDGGIARDVELFGNTGREGDWLPRVTARLAGWGTAEVLLDGQSVYSKLPAFFMVNDAIRRDDNRVALEDGTVFEPRLASTGGFADPRRQEITLMLHSDDIDKKNKPQNAVFIHLVFRGVSASTPDSGSSLKADPPRIPPQPASTQKTSSQKTSDQQNSSLRISSPSTSSPVVSSSSSSSDDDRKPSPSNLTARPAPSSDTSSTTTKKSKTQLLVEEKIAKAREAEGEVHGG